jgi:lipoate-protein ligase A
MVERASKRPKQTLEADISRNTNGGEVVLQDGLSWVIFALAYSCPSEADITTAGIKVVGEASVETNSVCRSHGSARAVLGQQVLDENFSYTSRDSQAHEATLSVLLLSGLKY